MITEPKLTKTCSFFKILYANCSNLTRQITPSDVQAEKYMPVYKISKNHPPKIFGVKGLDSRLGDTMNNGFQ